MHAIADFNPKAVILSGRPGKRRLLARRRGAPELFQRQTPVLGICYGMQTMAQQLGGAVSNASQREFGHAVARARGHSRLLRDLQDETNAAGHGLLHVWMSHGDRVDVMPEGFKIIASTENAPIAAWRTKPAAFTASSFTRKSPTPPRGKPSWSVSFTRWRVAPPAGTWRRRGRRLSPRIRVQVGGDQVLLALSGGVDSAVVAALLHEAIGPSSPACLWTTACCARAKARR